MHPSRLLLAAMLSILASAPGLPCAPACRAQSPAALTDEQQQTLTDAKLDLQRALDEQRNDKAWADAAVWHKGLTWALRYDVDAQVQPLPLAATAGTGAALRAGGDHGAPAGRGDRH